MQHSDQASYKDYLYLLAGTKSIDQLSQQDFELDTEDWSVDWGLPLEEFKDKRKTYLLY